MSDATREILEEVLGFLPYRGHDYVHWRDIVNQIEALASQAIVVECKVEHSKAWTIIKKEPGDGRGNLPNRLVIPGLHGTLGRAWAIILPDWKEGDDALHR